MTPSRRQLTRTKGDQSMGWPRVGSTRTLPLRLAAAGALGLLGLGLAEAYAQAVTRFISSPECPFQDDQPVLELTGVRVGSKEVAFDVHFDAGNDWLSGLVFRIKNRSRRPIGAVVLIFGLLENPDEELPHFASYEFGLQFIGSGKIETRRGRSRLTTLIGPGQEVDLTAERCLPYGLRHVDELLSGEALVRNPAVLAVTSGAHFRRANVMGADVWFTDGTRYSAELLVPSKCDHNK